MQHRFCAIFVSNTLRRNFQSTKRLPIQDMFYVQQFPFHFSHIFCHREYFLAYCISSHCKFCTNAQKKCVCVHFLRYRICALVFCDSFSILHVFPYNFVVTVCNIYKSAQIAPIYARFSVIFVRCGVKLFPVLCTNCFVLVRMF